MPDIIIFQEKSTSVHVYKIVLNIVKYLIELNAISSNSENRATL